MKKRFLLLLLVLITILPLLAQKIKMTIAYEDKEQPPYYMQNTQSIPDTNPGVCVEMVQLLQKYIPELEITLQRMPWKRCTFSLGENTVDGIFNSSYTKERLEIGWYPTLDKKQDGPVDKERRLTTITYSFYADKNGHFPWNGNFDSIKETVGAPIGYSIVNDLRSKGINVEEAPDSETNLLKVTKGRISAAALQEVTADAIIKANKKTFANIEKKQPPVVSKEYYLMLSKKFVQDNPRMAQKIWDTIKVIREKEFKKLVVKYQK